MKTRTRLIALVTAILALFALGARPASADDPSAESCCIDETGTVSETTLEYFAERSRNLRENCRGAQIFVMIVNTIGMDPIESYAQDVLKQRRIGDAEEENGVLVLMAVRENEYIIIPGSGLRSVLTPEVLTTISGSCCQPYFETGDYDTAALKTFQKLNEYICGHYGADSAGVPGGITGCSRVSCRNVGLFSLAAFGACVAIDIGSSIGGGK